MSFDRSVFVNCPFDSEYLPLLKALLFTIVYLGFSPQITLLTLNSGEPRITKILGLIRKSRFAIHDLSRSQAKKKGEIFRLNMPLELGLDVGCKTFKAGKWKKKRCLILEAKPYRYQAAISDLSNSDIKVHKGKPIVLVREVRGWLNNQARLNAPGPSKVWASYNDFYGWLYLELKKQGHNKRDVDNLPIDEFIQCTRKWCAKNPW
jgi:hypothetical protein